MSDEAGVDCPRTRLLFELSETEAGFHIKAVIVDDVGKSVGEFRTVDLSCADLPEQPDLAKVSADSVLFLDYGKQLFNLLRRGDLENSWTEAGQRHVGGIAFDIRSPTLAEIPWELLRADNATWAFCSTKRPAVRARIPYLPPRPSVPVPLHVLVVVGDPEDTSLAAEREVAAIFRGVCPHACWQVDVLRGPTAGEFHRRCRELLPQVIHFIGHYTIEGDRPALEVVVPGDETWKLDAITVAEAFEGEEPPRLVVLNACRTAELAVPAPFARGVSAAFFEEGCAAVVSMQGDLPGELAVPFSGELYRGLACGEPVDAAVAGARVAMKKAGTTHQAAWALPVIEVAVHPADVLRHDHVVEPDSFLPYRDLTKVNKLVDRTADRRTIHRRLRETGLLFVTGDGLVGKSELLRSCAMIQAFGGKPTVYVSLANRGNVSAIDFVKIVVEEAMRWLPHLSDSERELCDATLRVLPRPGEPVPVLPAGDTPKLMGTPRTAPDPVTFGYERLQGLLRSLAKRDPLILILDEMGEHNYWDANAFEKGLLVPVIDGFLARVHVVLAGNPQSVGNLAKGYLTTEREVRVGPFSAGEAEYLAREYVARERGTRYQSEETDEHRWIDFEERMVDWARVVAARPGDLFPRDLDNAAAQFRREAWRR